MKAEAPGAAAQPLLRRRCGALLLAIATMLAATCLFTPIASASVEFELAGSFGPDGTGGGEFSSVSSVAVDEGDGVLYVLDTGAEALYKFDLKGNPVDFGGGSPNVSGNELSGLSVGGANPGERQIAVNSATHVVYLTGQISEFSPKAIQAFHSDGDPAVFSATGTNQITGSPDFRRVVGLAVDEAGAIYSADGSSTGNGIQVYDNSGALSYSSLDAGDSLAAVGPFFSNIAVDSAGALYALHLGNAKKFVPSKYPVTPTTTYSLAGVVDPNNAYGIAVDRQTDNVYVAEYKPAPQVALFDKAGTSLGTFAGPGQEGQLKSPDGVAATTLKDRAFAYVGDNPTGGPSRVKVFAEKVCVCPPLVVATSVASLTGDSATLRARIHPNNLDTTYRFEYGPADCALGPCEQSEGGEIAAANRDVAVQRTLVGLQPTTTYHYRAVAENALGTAYGPDRTFTTQGSGLGFALPDRRAWEMVSPPEKFGGLVVHFNLTATQASVAGDKLAFPSFGSILAEPQANRIPALATVLAKRSPNGRWAIEDLSTPNHSARFPRGDTEHKLFTPDLSRAIYEAADPEPLTPLAAPHTPYIWDDGDPPTYTPLVPASGIPPGTGSETRYWTEGATPGLDRIVFAEVPGLNGIPQGNSLYTWTEGGGIEALSELPPSEGGGVVDARLGSGPGSVRGAISADSSRIFWQSYATGGLYLRDAAAGESVRLDIVGSGASGGGPPSPAFQGASAEGTVIFFTDSRHLVKGAGPEGRDLYRCEIPAGAAGAGCATLTDLSAPRKGSGESAQVLDISPAISADASRIYFLAKGVLDPAPNEQGEAAAAGEPNLYLWEEGSGVRFISRLSAEDHRIIGSSSFNEGGEVARLGAAASPDGRYLAFASNRSLTGYENTAADGEPLFEVYLYDAEASADRLTCISCNPFGASPGGVEVSKANKLPFDPGNLWGGERVVALLPQNTNTQASRPSLYQPRAVLADGRVFFNAVDPLVAADSNGDWDVYQYEPLGVGSCDAQTSSAAATRSGKGCIGLISSGTASGPSAFLDASPSGEDVFFTSPGRLSVLDKDEEEDVYDARVDGIVAELDPIRECAGEACRPAVEAPNDPSPASASFQGAGNPVQPPAKRCPKGRRQVKRKGHTVCKKKAKKKKTGHARAQRRAGR